MVLRLKKAITGIDSISWILWVTVGSFISLLLNNDMSTTYVGVCCLHFMVSILQLEPEIDLLENL